MDESFVRGGFSLETTLRCIETFAVRLPLPAPITIGGTRFDFRDYAVLRVTAEDGVVGHAYCLSRSLPIDVHLAETLGPRIIGRPIAPGGIDVISTDGVAARARSMLDVALWDVESQRRGLPLWQLLGDDQDRVDVLFVDGYPRVNEDALAFGARLAACEPAARWHKIAYVHDEEEMVRRLTSARRALDPSVRIVVDVAWQWEGAESSSRIASTWSTFDLAWIEDPFRVDRSNRYANLHRDAPAPLGAGDEALDSGALVELANSGDIDVVRFDLMTLGGISGFRAIDAQLRSGIPVSPHIYPEINRHLAFASSRISHVEWFGDSGEFDRANSLVRLVDGRLDSGGCTRPEAPGLGMDIDWKIVHNASYRTRVVEHRA